MLQTFRERLQGWIIGTIILLLILPLGFFGLENFFAGGRSQVVARVGNYKIYEDQLNKVFEQLRQHAAASNISLNDSTQALLKKEALSLLIKKQVELKSVLKAGFTLSQTQIEKVVTNLPYFQEKGKFSYQKFQQFLAYNGFTEAHFLAELQDAVLVDQLKLAIMYSAFVLKKDVEQIVALKNQMRSFEYIVIPHTSFITKIEPTRNEIQSYYEKNKTGFKTPERVKVDYILLSSEQVKKNLKVTEGEIKTHYEENKSSFGDKPLDVVKNQIRQILLSEKLQTALSSLSDQLSELAYTHTDNLTTASTTLNLPIKTSEFFTKAGGTSIFSELPVIQAAFGSDVLLERRNSDLIRLKDGSVMVLRLKQHAPSSILPLEKVEARIVAKLKNEKELEQIQNESKNWLSMLREGKEINALLKQHKLKWKPANITTSNVDGVNSEIVNFVFSIPENALKNGKLVYEGKILANGDYALVKLKSIDSSNLNLSQSEKEALVKKIEAEYGQLDYGFYLESIMKKAKVKVEENFET